ncbi:isoform 2 of phospholipase a1-igamma1, chloroplastic [Fagus crenata]
MTPTKSPKENISAKWHEIQEYCGSCRYNRHKLFEEFRPNKNGYKVTKYIYAMSHVDVPQWLERSHLGETWRRFQLMGYVAVSNNEESERIGRRDIVMAWRYSCSN